ncbi:MAG: MATE family efflux transporter [Gammaproteobacteria bacterium]|nr:MATE family efflux transporter [Gammaproteobacteria bacterium]
MNRWPALVEFRSLGVLAVPIIITQLAQMGMGVADAIMAGRVSATDLAGIALGGNLYWPLMLLMSGIVMAVTPSVSQLHGAGRAGDAGAVVRQALWIAVCGGAALAVALQNVEPAYRLLGVDERAIPVAAGYLAAASLGLPAMLAYVALRCLCEGMSWTRPAMFIGLTMLAVKIVLNWLFIHGQPALGIPAMGGVGCGWSTAVVMACSLAVMVVIVSFSRMRESGAFAAFSWPNPAEIGRLLRLGLPIGLALFVEVAFFSGATLLIGRLGVEIVAAHQVAFNIVGVTFMVPLALGMAATIRVGFNVGANDFAGASRSAWVAACTSIAWGVVFAAALLTWRHDLVALYTSETDVIQLAAGLLLLGALFQVVDGPQATVMGTLRGYKDTRAPMVIALVAYWLVGLPVGATLCFGLLGVPGIGVYGMWWGLVAGLAVVAGALFARLARISRDPVRVAQLRLR